MLMWPQAWQTLITLWLLPISFQAWGFQGLDGRVGLSLAKRLEGPCLPPLICTLTSALGHLYRGWAFRDWGVLEHKVQVTPKIIATKIIITTIMLEIKLTFRMHL